MFRHLHPRPRISVPAVLAISCGLLTACGSSPAPGGAASSPAVTVTASAGSGSSSPEAASASASASTSAGLAGCLAASLQAQLGASQGTAGTLYQVIDLTNTSSASCTLYGYPGVSFVTGAGGSQVGKPATRDTVDPASEVTLAPGAEANLLLAVHDAGAIANCKLTNVDWVRIYPPGDFGSLNVHYSSQACAGASKSIMTVTAMRPGAGTASY